VHLLLAAGFTFTGLIQQVVSGAGAGAVYATLALALVLIYRAMDVANFAQGEMAMFSTYIAYALVGGDFGLLGTKLGFNGLHLGLPQAFWIAFAIAVVASFGLGILIERVLIRPFEGAPLLTLVIVTLGLFSIVNGLAGFNWGYVFKTFCCPFPSPSPPLATTHSLPPAARIGKAANITAPTTAHISPTRMPRFLLTFPRA